VVIVEENESYGNIAGNTTQAPYLNQLISQGELFTNYTGVADGSNPERQQPVREFRHHGPLGLGNRYARCD
jgi:hypothetical protein